MYQLYQSIAQAISKEAQETEKIKINGNDYFFTYINRIINFDTSKKNNFFLDSLHYPFVSFIGDLTIHECVTDMSFKIQDSISNDNLTLTETNGVIEFKETNFDTISLLSTSGSTVKLHLKGFLLMQEITEG